MLDIKYVSKSGQWFSWTVYWPVTRNWSFSVKMSSDKNGDRDRKHRYPRLKKIFTHVGCCYPFDRIWNFSTLWTFYAKQSSNIGDILPAAWTVSDIAKRKTRHILIKTKGVLSLRLYSAVYSGYGISKAWNNLNGKWHPTYLVILVLWQCVPPLWSIVIAFILSSLL